MARRRHASPYWIFALIALALIGTAVGLLIWKLAWHPLLAYLVSINVCTFLFYGYDKSAARRSWLRIPERVLHALAFLGGTPGAWIGQRTFHHKTVKRSFRIAFWVLAVVQVGLIAWTVWAFHGN